ncbi:6697_t:CDS:2, partial [Acaulospora colombiana]
SIGLHPRSVWNVVNAGDGYIRVMQPSQPTLSEPILPKSMDIRVERDIVERLINSYFSNISPIFPVITKSEFVAFQPNPPPMLLYSICLMAASLRDTPAGIFDHLRRTVASLIRSEDVLSTPTQANVQALLILSMAGDCHGTQGNLLMSYAWTRTGTAIRMAQDLNLHRAEISRDGIRRHLAILRSRYRIPQCPYKAVHHSGRGVESDLQDILRRLELWKIHLPEELAFTGPDSGPAAVFMRISFICPPHIQFCLNVTEWSKVIDNSRSAIEWFVKHDRYWETWFPTSYALVSCALCQ